MLRDELNTLQRFSESRSDFTKEVQNALKVLTDINFALDAALIIAITDVQGTIIFANKEFCRISKYTRDELLGQNHKIVNSGHHPVTFFRQMWRTIGNGHIWRGEIKNRAKDGSFYWMDTTIVPCTNDQGKPYQYVSFRNEITAKKLAEERLDNLIATMPDIVVFQDGDGHWITANKSAKTFFGLHGIAIVGRTTGELAETATQFGEALMQFASNDSEIWHRKNISKYELTLHGSPQQPRIFEITKVPVFHNSGNRSGLIIVGKDITEQKQTEVFIRRADRAVAVGQLASGIAHEIRNPLAAIKWTLQLLNLHDEADKQHLEAVFSELERIDGIVGEMMGLAKPHEAKYVSTKLDNILLAVTHLMQSQATRSRVVLDVEIDPLTPAVRCEPNQLKQVLINLIKNSIEAMQSGGHVRIQVQPLTPCEVRIRVIDDGCGIPEEMIPRLGEPFFSTKEKGNGLGMMVCHKIIQDHDGRMDITSRLNEGTTIDVILPLNP